VRIDEHSCKICGGWARQLPESGAHALCAARREVGLPTPSLGERCTECGGAGHLGKPGVGLMLGFDLGPGRIKRAIEAAFPTCGSCGGSGTI